MLQQELVCPLKRVDHSSRRYFPIISLIKCKFIKTQLIFGGLPEY